MIISDKQFEAFEGGIEQLFIKRLFKYAKENLANYIQVDDNETLKKIIKIREQAAAYDITTELNIARLMIICLEHNIVIPFAATINFILHHNKWDESKKLEELLFFTSTGLEQLKEITVSFE